MLLKLPEPDFLVGTKKRIASKIYLGVCHVVLRVK